MQAHNTKRPYEHYRLIIRIFSQTGDVYLVTRHPIYAFRAWIIDLSHRRRRHRKLLRYSRCIVHVGFARRIGTSMLSVVYRFQLEESGKAIVSKIVEGQIVISQEKKRDWGEKCQVCFIWRVGILYDGSNSQTFVMDQVSKLNSNQEFLPPHARPARVHSFRKWLQNVQKLHRRQFW